MEVIGVVLQSIKTALNIEVDVDKIVIVEESFKKHLQKRHHENMIPLYNEIPEIISNPDYIGVNPREKGTSMEYIKIMDDNILVGIKLDVKHNYFYVATMHEISDLKLQQRLKNGRIIPFDTE